MVLGIIELNGSRLIQSTIVGYHLQILVYHSKIMFSGHVSIYLRIVASSENNKTVCDVWLSVKKS